MNILNTLTSEKYKKVTITVILLIVWLFWRIIKDNVLLIVLIGALLWILYSHKGVLMTEEKEGDEGFDWSGNRFVDVGEPRFDLKGDLLRTRPINEDDDLNYCKYE